jgi:predicted nucleic acid-binding protein
MAVRVRRLGVLTHSGLSRSAAIHLGTALHARPALTCFVTYDKRLLDAATAAGLPTEAPA